jgi:hypothetical protein
VSRSGRSLPPGKDPQYPLDRNLGGPQSWSGHRGYRKNPSPLPGFEHWDLHYSNDKVHSFPVSF